MKKITVKRVLPFKWPTLLEIKLINNYVHNPERKRERNSTLHKWRGHEACKRVIASGEGGVQHKTSSRGSVRVTFPS